MAADNGSPSAARLQAACFCILTKNLSFVDYSQVGTFLLRRTFLTSIEELYSYPAKDISSGSVFMSAPVNNSSEKLLNLQSPVFFPS